METKYYSILDIGSKRKVNEDSIMTFEPQDEKQLLEKGCIYIVADGVGGLNKGDVASKTVIETVKTEYYNFASRDIKESLKFAINKANTVLIGMREEDEKLASTIVCAVIKDNIAYIANVGDSRAYLFRNRKLTRKTNDHSFVGERMRMGELTEEEARVHPRKNIILRCVGDTKDLEIDFFEVALEKNDKLLLCTDGLWGEMPHKILEETLNTKTEASLENLKKQAYENGAHDNIGAILIDIIKLDVNKVKVIPTGLKSLKIGLGLAAAFAVIFLALSGYLAINFYDFDKPVAKIVINPDGGNGQIPAEFTFDSRNSTDNKEIISYQWSIVGERNSQKPLYFYTATFSNKFEIPDTYTVKLVCIDKYGNQSQEATDKITVVDKANPEITVKQLDKSSEYFLGYDIFANFDISVSDNYKLEKITISEKPDGEPNWVLLQEFSVIDNNSWNYKFQHEVKKAGNISLQIVATDSSGNMSIKDLEELGLQVLKDENPPEIKSFTINESNTELIKIPKIGAIIKLSAVVKDNKEISKVEFLDGDISLGTVNNAPYDCFWNVVAPGEYKLIVVAYDKDNNKTIKEIKVTAVMSGYFVFTDNSGTQSEIYLSNLDNNKKTKLTFNSFEDLSPVLSVNEDAVYFVSNRNGFYELYSMGLNGKNLQRLSYFKSVNKIFILSAVSNNELLIKFEVDPNTADSINNNLNLFSIKDKAVIRKILP